MAGVADVASALSAPTLPDGDLDNVVAEMDRIRSLSPVRPTCIQVSLFPGTGEADIQEMMAGLKALVTAFNLLNPVVPATVSSTEDKVDRALRAR